VQTHRYGEGRENHRPHAIAADHRPTAIETVGERAGWQPHDEGDQRGDGTHGAGDDRRTGESQDQQGVGEHAEPGPEIRQHLARPEHPEVTVAAEGNRGSAAGSVRRRLVLAHDASDTM